MTNGTPGWKGYYLSAYGIAVKHGYRGTEKEWLQSLKQEAVDAGEKALESALEAELATEAADAATQAAREATGIINDAVNQVEEQGKRLLAHEENGDNPHGVTAAQLGLGKALILEGGAAVTYDGTQEERVTIPDGKRTCRFVIGTSTAGWTENDCDYLCDGVDDQEEINAAIQALPEWGGECVLLDGNYYCGNQVLVNRDHVALRGEGGSTRFHLSSFKFTPTPTENTGWLVVSGNCCRVEKISFVQEVVPEKVFPSRYVQYFIQVSGDFVTIRDLTGIREDDGATFPENIITANAKNGIYQSIKSTVPDSKALIYARGENCRYNTFTDCVCSMSILGKGNWILSCRGKRFSIHRIDGGGVCNCLITEYLEMTGAKNTVFSGNTLKSEHVINGGIGRLNVWFWLLEDSVISDNIFDFSEGPNIDAIEYVTLVKLEDCTRVIFSGNIIHLGREYPASSYSLLIVRGVDCTFVNNTMMKMNYIELLCTNNFFFNNRY